mgnify:CR=1 FL=1
MRPREDQLAAADYVPLGTDAEGRQQLFCAACRKETMEEYLAMTDRLGLRLQSVTVTMAGRLKLLHAMQSMQGKTCIWLCFEGSSVLSLLVENGEYRYSSRSRIFSEPGTVDFGTEMTRNVSGTMQFHTASRSGGTLTDVYYAAARMMIRGVSGGYPRSGAESEPSARMPCVPRHADRRAAGRLARLCRNLIRTVLRANKELDLLRSYRRLSRGSKGQTGLLHSFYTPIAVCLVVCAAVWCVFLQMNSSLSHRTGDINDWLNDPTVIEQYNEAAEKQQRNDNLVQGLQQVRNLTDALATYPQVDSALMSKIGAAGGAQVSMVLTGYDAATGALQFDAQSGSVIDIPSYVLKLQKTGLFRKVDYTGYTYEDGVYVLSLNCILLGEEAAE